MMMARSAKATKGSLASRCDRLLAQPFDTRRKLFAQAVTKLDLARWHRSRLPGEAWRRVLRLRVEGDRAGGSAPARPRAIMGQRKARRERIARVADAQPAAVRDLGPLGGLRLVARRARGRAAPALGDRLRPLVFVEVFSGSCRLVAAVAHEGYNMLLWDLSLGPGYDLLRRGPQRLMMGWVRAGLLIGVPQGTRHRSFVSRLASEYPLHLARAHAKDWHDSGAVVRADMFCRRLGKA